jgi:hypothetical protein
MANATVNALKRCCTAATLCVIVLTGSGCSLGRTKVSEVHYYAIPNGENTNYYRLRVEANTQLGNAEYRSGWFPTRAVDSLFGDVTSDGGIAALAVRTTLENAYSQKVQDTTTAWLEEAGKPNPDAGLLADLFRARRRILAYPSSEGSPYAGHRAVEAEFNPIKGLVRAHADEKLVFILSSNPDEVIQNISNFAESEKTSLAVTQLSGVIAQRVRNDVAAAEATQSVDKRGDKLISTRIQAAIDATKADPTAPTAIREIDSVLSLVNAIRP